MSLVGEYLKRTFSGTASTIGVITGLLALGFAFFPVAGIQIEYRIIAAGILVMLFLLAVFAVRSFQYYQAYRQPIPVIRQFKGTGLNAGRTLLSLENPGTVRENAILTLYSTSSGLPQSMGYIQIIRCVPGEDLQAVPYPNSIRSFNFGAGDDEREIRDAKMFATPLVHAIELDAVISSITGEQ